MTGAPTLFPVDRLELALAPKPWAFAEARRAEIDAYFAGLQREKPEIWNGRVLLMHRQKVSAGVFTGDYLETDYASFAAWQAWGLPPAGAYDCFGAAALQASDGGFLLGRMGAHTFHAGQVYFPCGTPDPDDVVDGRVDLAGNVRRELKEETGLAAEEFDVAPGWTAVVDGPLIAQIKLMRAHEDAESLRARVKAHLARERRPELADILIVRGPADFDAAMPRFVTAFLARQFGD
jgi:8-oxo-dGTP pyrophosphatase MutT (NUDIX family)